MTDEDPSHYFGVQGAIDLEKLVNDEDADEAPGPFVPVGGAITWTYRVTNIGNSRLTGVEVDDLDPGVQVTCPPTVAVLDVNESVDCTATATAQAGAHTDLASATGQTEAGDVRSRPGSGELLRRPAGDPHREVDQRGRRRRRPRAVHPGRKPGRLDLRRHELGQ